jgi:hypothetical protein
MVHSACGVLKSGRYVACLTVRFVNVALKLSMTAENSVLFRRRAVQLNKRCVGFHTEMDAIA